MKNKTQNHHTPWDFKNKTKIVKEISVSYHALKNYNKICKNWGDVVLEEDKAIEEIREIFFSALEVNYVYPSDEIAEKVLHKTKGRHFRSLDKRWILVTDKGLKIIITIFESRSDKRWTTKKWLARKWWAKNRRRRK